MDKITRQIRAEHWTKVLNECINSGMSKTAWCRANGISEKQLFYWQRILRRGLSRIPTSLLPAAQSTVTFTEIKPPPSLQSAAPVFHSDLVIRKGEMIPEISNSASVALLLRIGGILNAE